MIIKMEKLANTTFYAIETSWNRVKIGKLWWKSLSLSAVLFGVGVINLNSEHIRRMQIIENRVYRLIMRAKGYTPVAAIRGEFGSLTMENRIIESRLLLVKSIQEGNNELVKDILRKVMKDEEINGIYNKLKEYTKKMDITYKELEKINRMEIRKKVREIDTINWRKEMEEKKNIKCV
ncbi:unnamed protein product [Meganyctiphanes norvegica]|uniref:Uncharacterized protein n=1 Tax=Meganyctiphanes norvegica TaxID=48144 RepID=A0AAV2PMK9_MEGNR